MEVTPIRIDKCPQADLICKCGAENILHNENCIRFGTLSKAVNILRCMGLNKTPRGRLYDDDDNEIH